MQECSIAISFSINKHTFIGIAVHKCVNTKTGSFIIQPIAIVPVAISKGIQPLAVHSALFPLAYIGFTQGRPERTLAIQFSI